ncbi:MAG: chemotaxis protein CheW [Xanthobacteraceae bacterium]
MASLDQLKGTFFDECSEALQQIELGLSDLREGTASDDTINAVFRSVHSVKGGAGIFGFDDLVKFAHVFETVLDAMRGGKLASTQEIVDTLLQANDILSDLIGMSRSGEAIPADYGAECRAGLERILHANATGDDLGDDGSPAPADFEGLDFVPVRAEEFDAPEEQPGDQEYRIVFRPKSDLLKKANEPLYILRELRKLGALDLGVETDRLPLLDALEPDTPYLGWNGTLRTPASQAQIQEVFEFVLDDCELEISAVEAADAEPLPDTPADMIVPPGPLPASSDDGGVAAAVPETMTSSPPIAPNLEAEAPEAAPQPRSAPSKSSTAGGATTTRVELEKIDRVVNMVGELVIAQAMLGQVVHSLPEDVTGRLVQVLEEVVHHTRELKDSVMSMRAQQVSAGFQRMPRLVRELAAKTGKKARLEMLGENTEVDRSIIERLGDPLTHIIRNAVDHGIAAPEIRAAAGKPEEGTVRLAAEHRGGRIVIEVSDDGAGINPERVLKKARDRGLVSGEGTLTEDEINNLIFLPGFSTAESVSDISGRGVGMDVVRRNIQDLGGRITVKSERGRGMTIQLALPLTLAVMDGMVVRVAQETYVMQMSSIVECLRPPASDIHSLLGTRGILQLRGNLVPLVHLCELLDIGTTNTASAERVVIISDAGDGARFGIVVDELLGHQQVVVKSIEESYGPVPGIAGATILGNGRVAFILDIEKLSDLAGQNMPSAAAPYADAAAAVQS